MHYFNYFGCNIPQNTTTIFGGMKMINSMVIHVSSKQDQNGKHPAANEPLRMNGEQRNERCAQDGPRVEKRLSYRDDS